MAGTDDIRDAVIVGGGIVGLAAALAIARTGRCVALVERAPPTRLRGKLGFDTRTVALTPASKAHLCGLADDASALPTSAMAAIRTMRVWEFDGSASLGFEDPCALAWVAENSAVTTALWSAAAGRVELIARASVVDVVEARERIVLTLDGAAEAAAPRVVPARLVIAADGANSAVRTLSGVDVRGDAIPAARGQRALATIAKMRRAHGHVAWQRFGRSGPVALLPLPDEHCVSVIWSTSESVHAQLSALDDAGFAAALAEETEGINGGVDAVDRRVAFPLRQSLAADLNPTPRTLIIGDAARTLHPLAGQGVNLGLEDVYALGVTANAGGDLGAPGTWRDFARDRRMRSKAMLAAMRGLLAAYCGPYAANPWMRLMRNAAIRRIDASRMVKAQLIREAMGVGPLSESVGRGAP